MIIGASKMYISIPIILILIGIIEGVDWNNESPEYKEKAASYALPLFLKKSEILKQYGLDKETDIRKLKEDIDTCYVKSRRKEYPSFSLNMIGFKKYNTSTEIIAKFILFSLNLSPFSSRSGGREGIRKSQSADINHLWSIQEKIYLGDTHKNIKAEYEKLYDVLAILVAQDDFSELRSWKRMSAEANKDHVLLQIIKDNNVFEEPKKRQQKTIRLFREIYLSAQYRTLIMCDEYRSYRNKWLTTHYVDPSFNFSLDEDVLGTKELIEKCINHNNFSFDLNKIDTNRRMQKKFSKIAEILLETGGREATRRTSINAQQRSERKYKIYEHQDAVEKIVELYKSLAALAALKNHSETEYETFKSIHKIIHYYNFDSKQLRKELKKYKKRGGELTKYGIDKNMNVDKLKEAIDKCYVDVLHRPFCECCMDRDRYDSAMSFGVPSRLHEIDEPHLRSVIARVAGVRAIYEDFEHDDAKRVYAALYGLLAMLAAHQGKYADFIEFYIKMKDTEFAIKQENVAQSSWKILDEEANEMLTKVLGEKHVLRNYGIEATQVVDVLQHFKCSCESHPHINEILATITDKTKSKEEDFKVRKFWLSLAGQHLSMAEEKFEKLYVKMTEAVYKKSFMKNFFTKIKESYTTSKERKMLEYQEKIGILNVYSIKSMADAETIEHYFSNPMTNGEGSKMIPDMELIYDLMLTMAAQDVAAARKKFVEIFEEYKKL